LDGGAQYLKINIHLLTTTFRGAQEYLLYFLNKYFQSKIDIFESSIGFLKELLAINELISTLAFHAQ
jgi:hypothetical protein